MNEGGGGSHKNFIRIDGGPENFVKTFSFSSIPAPSLYLMTGSLSRKLFTVHVCDLRTSRQGQSLSPGTDIISEKNMNSYIHYKT